MDILLAAWLAFILLGWKPKPHRATGYELAILFPAEEIVISEIMGEGFLPDKRALSALKQSWNNGWAAGSSRRPHQCRDLNSSTLFS
jgi:hypothetical protein